MENGESKKKRASRRRPRWIDYINTTSDYFGSGQSLESNNVTAA
jgi:hypothetical protein